ncbi:MAG TPA: hypothetical protein PKA38_01095 [Candidatus Levybacteria bacterium]|nr:hypothetical protein [Candidatus Levybacteria bacterium]
MKKKLKAIYNKEVLPDLYYFFLIGIVLLFIIFRIPSLVEPDWYGDEGIYQVIGRALHENRLLYRDIWDNKPPLLYLYYALVRGDMFLARLMSLIFGAGAVIVFFFIAKTIFYKKNISLYLSTSFFALLFGIPLLEGNIANAENFMLLPILLSLFFVVRLNSRSKIITPILIGGFLSVAFLTKIVAIFDLAAFLVILFTIRFYNKSLIDARKHLLSRPIEFLKVLKQEGIILISFFVPILITILFFMLQGSLSDYLKASFAQNIGYVGYGNYFLIPQGLLILKLIALFLGVFLIIILRKKIGIAGIVVYTWLIFSIFNAFFSGRPYTHYVLVFLPSFCLLLGLLFAVRKHIIVNISLIVFLVVFFKINFTYYTKIIPYYRNYFDFVMGDKSVKHYQSFFDANTPRNYEVAEFLKMNTQNGEGIFLLSDSSTIYYLTNKLPPGRYIVEYHISSYPNGINETKQALNKLKPKYIVVTKERFARDFLTNYDKKYVVSGITVYEQQY